MMSTGLSLNGLRWPIALTGLALGLRLPTIADRPLWLDESITWQVATASDPLRASAELDLQPPTHALLARAASVTGAPTPLAMRLPALVASVVSVPVAWAAGAALGGAPVAFAAALLTATHPAMVAYGHEGRPYALGALGTWLVLWGLVGGSPRVSALSAVLATLTTWTSGVFAAALACSFRRWWALVSVAVVGGAMAPLAWEQWSHRGAEHAARQGVPLALWDLPQALGATLAWCATGLAGTGFAAWFGLLLLSVPLRKEAKAALLTSVGLALIGVAPLAGSRHAVVMLPAILLSWAVVMANRPKVLAGLTLMWTVIGVARSPGVPVENVAGLCGPERILGRVVVDYSAAPQWRAADCGAALILDRPVVLTDLEPGVNWVVSAGRGRDATRAALAIAARAVRRRDAEGASAVAWER